MLFTNKAFFFQVHGESFIVNLMTGFNHGEEKCKRKKRKREKDKERKRKVKQSTEHLVFFTVDNVWRKEKVEKLNLPVPEETSKDSDKTFSPLTLTAPSAFHHTKPDGNCFFNALSFVITGCEDHHFDIRQMICNHLISHEEELKLYLPTLCHGSAQKYLQKSCMRTNTI